jgi:UDP-N-acetyl-D-glucosamine/UDP-N-acetyl-D-galactosamine dehydrogenase
MNDGMGAYVALQLIKAMIKKSIQIEGARVLIMGLAFKENCPDLRNTRVVDVISELADYNLQIDVFDPWVDVTEAEHEYGISPISEPESGGYDAVVLAVAHEQFKALGAEGIRAFSKPSSVVYDLKYVLPTDSVELRL